MDVRSAVEAKIKRLQKLQPPRILDLFSGCGGLSLGFKRAGFQVVGAVECDHHAIRTHAQNFHSASDPNWENHAKPRDITLVDPSDLLAELQIEGSPKSSIDVIVGGPPCQAFARVGRAKLREIDKHPEAFLRDPRSNLYLRYLHYVRELAPLALLMENVPDVMNFGGHNVADEVCDVLDEIGYTCGYTLLNAAYFGVPQMRERMFLLAFRKELKALIEFPQPTHWVELPPGYSGTRNVALRVLVEKGYRSVQGALEGIEPSQNYYQDPPVAQEKLLPAVTTEDAIRDLPEILARKLHNEGKLKRGVRRLNEFVPYRDDMPPTLFADAMRSWPGFESDNGIYDHVIRSLPRDYPIFAKMKPGDQYPEAHALAQRLCERERRRKGIRIDSLEHEKLRQLMIPPYDPGKFPNKWRKLEAYLPSRTLMAHIGKDTYSHIHYDDAQSRTISVREAARLQSFPDGFLFSGTMNPAFRQIGNAVPPILAFALAGQIKKSLEKCLANRVKLRRKKALAAK